MQGNRPRCQHDELGKLKQKGEERKKIVVEKSNGTNSSLASERIGSPCHLGSSLLLPFFFLRPS